MGLSAVAATSGIPFAHASAAHHASAAKHHAKATKAAVGSGLGAISASATASAMSIPLYSHSGEDVQATVPYATTNLNSGGIGQALTSIFWPGATGANGGSALSLLGVPASLANQLNDPELAEAQTGVGDPTVSKSAPGVSMVSTATTDEVSATTTAAGSSVPGIGSVLDGGTQALTKTKVSGPRTVTTMAYSSVHDVTIAKVITIGAVTSTARGVTNGRKAHGTANTVVSGVKIAGIPVTIDANGVHVSKSSLPLGLGNTVTTVVNKALNKAGVQIQLTNVRKTVHKAHVTLSSGALEFKLDNASFKSQANDTGTLITLGGVSLDAIASPSFPTPPVIKQPVSSPGKTGSPGTPGTPGTPGVPGTQVPSGGSSVGTAPTTAQNLSPELAGAQTKLPSTMKVWWVVLALLGAAFFAFGMKRLPDEVLAANGPACRLEETA
jgi:hypothetical protein